MRGLLRKEHPDDNQLLSLACLKDLRFLYLSLSLSLVSTASPILSAARYDVSVRGVHTLPAIAGRVCAPARVLQAGRAPLRRAPPGRLLLPHGGLPGALLLLLARPLKVLLVDLVVDLHPCVLVSRSSDIQHMSALHLKVFEVTKWPWT